MDVIEKAALLAHPPRRAGLAGWAAFALVAAAILGSLPWTWFPVDEPVRDEYGHVPLVRRWIAHPETVSIADFPEPKGVGFFAAARLWGMAFGTSCMALRSMNVVAALAALAAWVWLTGLWGLGRRGAAVVALPAVPYVFINTQLLHTEIPTLLLIVTGLACMETLRQGGRWRWAIAAVVVLGALPWVRQTMLIVPLTLLACSPWMRRYRIRCAAAAGIALLSVVPMLLLWGGLVPPGPAKVFAGAGFYPDTFGFALAVLGAFGWPLLLIGLPARGERWLLLAGVGLGVLLYCTGPLDYTSENRMGLFQKFLASIPAASWQIRSILCAAICVGGLVLGRLAWLALAPRQVYWVRLACAIALARLALFAVATPVFFDRYLLIVLVMIYAIAAERAPRLLAGAFIVAMLLVAASHVLYITRRPHVDGLTPLQNTDLQFSASRPEKDKPRDGCGACLVPARTAEVPPESGPRPAANGAEGSGCSGHRPIPVVASPTADARRSDC